MNHAGTILVPLIMPLWHDLIKKIISAHVRHCFIGARIRRRERIILSQERDVIANHTFITISSVVNQDSAVVIEHKRCPTRKISQQQKPESKQTGSEFKHFARRGGVPAARRETRRVRVARRAGCAPEDAPVARRKTRGKHVGGRASCTPQDVPGACRVRARRAPCARVSRAGRPVRPFSSRSGLPELRGRAAGGRRHARRGPQECGASLALLRALARLEPKPGRREVPPGFAVLFQKQKGSGAKHTKKQDASVRESGARACASWPSAPGNSIAKPKHA